MGQVCSHLFCFSFPLMGYSVIKTAFLLQEILLQYVFLAAGTPIEPPLRSHLVSRHISFTLSGIKA